MHTYAYCSCSLSHGPRCGLILISCRRSRRWATRRRPAALHEEGPEMVQPELTSSSRGPSHGSLSDHCFPGSSVLPYPPDWTKYRTCERPGVVPGSRCLRCVYANGATGALFDQKRPADLGYRPGAVHPAWSR